MKRADEQTTLVRTTEKALVEVATSNGLCAVDLTVPVDAAELVSQVGDFEENPGEIPLELPLLS